MDYVVRLTGQDNLSGTINNVKGAVNDLSNSVSNLDKFTDKFKRIEGSAAPLKRQLRDLKAIMAEMNFQGLSGTEEFTRIAQYAGQISDAMGDASAATRRFADDTFALKAAADTMTVVTGAFTAVTGAMSLFGVENENVKNAILKVQSAMAILNGVQAIANALNKDSALMQALKAMRMKISEAVTRANTNAINANTVAERVSMATTKQDTVAKAANTVAETANGVATKKSTVIQNAWNVAKAIAKALLGDFTGLALVAAGAVATYALATANSTDKIEDQSKALKGNNTVAEINARAKKQLAEQEKKWGESVASSVAEQLSKYTLLQAKWVECNKDQKLREKFQREYGDEVNRVAGKVLKLSEYENFFVRDTDKVVAAIRARAEAEANAKLYQEALETKLRNDYNGTVANGRFRPVAHEGDVIGKGYLTKEAMSAAHITGADLNILRSGKPTLKKSGADIMNAYWAKMAEERKKVDSDAVNHWLKETLKSAKIAEEANKAAGMGSYSSGRPSAYDGKGGKGKKDKKGGKGGDKKGDKKDKETPEQRLQKLETAILKMKHNIDLNLIPDDKLNDYINNLKKLGVEYNDLAREQDKPLIGSLDWMKKELSSLQSMLSSGGVGNENIDAAKKAIKNLETEIENEEIELGFKDPKTLEEKLDDQIKDFEKYLATNLDILPQEKIDETKNKIKDLTKQKFELRVRLGLEDALRTDFEKNDFADKYINDWRDLSRYADEYAKKWEEYQQNLRKYEADMAEYNAAWDEYNRKTKEYNEAQKKYAKWQKLTAQVEKDWNDDKISSVAEYNAKMDEAYAKVYGAAAAAEKAADREETMQYALAGVREEYEKGLLTLEEYNDRVKQIQQVTLDNVLVNGLGKPIKPKLEMPKKPFDPMVHALIDDIYSALDGIPAHTEKLMSEVEEMLQNNELPIGVRIELANNVKQQLQERLDEQTHGKLSIKATVEPEYIETGSQWDMRKSYENQSQKINQVADDYARGIIKSSSEARSQIAALNAELVKLGMKPIEIEIKTKGQQVLEDIQGYIGVFNTSIISTVDSFEQLARSIDEGASGWEIFKNTIAATEQVLTAITTIMQLVNTLTAAHTAKKQADTATTKADIGVTLGDAAAKKAAAGAAAGEAVAETGRQNAKMGPFGWVAAIVGAVALAATLFSLMGKFAGGGIVGGNSFRGDKLIARVNSGEMILNGKQQKNLFDAINNNRLGSDGSQSISFKIKGSDLYGTLRNYSKIKGKSGVTTGIQ